MNQFIDYRKPIQYNSNLKETSDILKILYDNNDLLLQITKHHKCIDILV